MRCNIWILKPSKQIWTWKNVTGRFICAKSSIRTILCGLYLCSSGNCRALYSRIIKETLISISLSIAWLLQQQPQHIAYLAPKPSFLFVFLFLLLARALFFCFALTQFPYSRFYDNVRNNRFKLSRKWQWIGLLSFFNGSQIAEPNKK